MKAVGYCLSAGLLAVLCACSATTQTSSGSNYLANYPPQMSPPPAAPAGRLPTLDEEVAQAASIEPIARFPMKIGLVRVDHGNISPIPEAEAKLWWALYNKLGNKYGQLEMLDPLVAEFAEQAAGPRVTPYGYNMQNLVRKIRLGAARQHLDSVLIYEPATSSKREDTPLQLLNLTIVGYYLMPSTEVQAEASVHALLMDVRNGYPYARISGRGSSSGLAAGNMVSDSMRDRSDIARTDAVKSIIAQIEPTLVKLDRELTAVPQPFKASSAP